ncbi:MAG: hypothetical protein EPO42_14370 [Gallionellaceae bacterium]|nr:MAG: hypothetical protein EPO42_14370 [Gallionellaceae bacterium]
MNKGMTRDVLGRLTALPAEERFWVSVKKTRRCWLWTASADEDGYGWFTGFGQRKAHRASWVLHHGRIPPRKQVLHHCDTPGCVRPDHLCIGTNVRNHADKRLRGRSKGINAGSKNGMRTHPEARSLGSRNGGARLDEGRVLEMRRLRREGLTYRAIAARFGVHHSTAVRAVRGDGWRHVATIVAED